MLVSVKFTERYLCTVYGQKLTLPYYVFSSFSSMDAFCNGRNTLCHYFITNRGRPLGRTRTQANT